MRNIGPHSGLLQWHEPWINWFCCDLITINRSKGCWNNYIMIAIYKKSEFIRCQICPQEDKQTTFKILELWVPTDDYKWRSVEVSASVGSCCTQVKKRRWRSFFLTQFTPFVSPSVTGHKCVSISVFALTLYVITQMFFASCVNTPRQSVVSRWQINGEFTDRTLCMCIEQSYNSFLKIKWEIKGKAKIRCAKGMREKHLNIVVH